MSYQSEIHCKMAIFNPKSHAPETSEGSESASILLVRIFFICRATFPSFDILSLALAERGFRGGLLRPIIRTCNHVSNHLGVTNESPQSTEGEGYIKVIPTREGKRLMKHTYVTFTVLRLGFPKQA